MPRRSNLGARLQQLRSTEREEVGKRSAFTTDISQQEFSGWRCISPFVYYRSTQRPLGPSLTGETEKVYLLSDPSVRWKDCLFFDTETTGLSGGAGNYIFLLGIARVEDTGVRLEQFFLSDFPGEPDFLSAVIPRIEDAGLLVSYNGKAFDSNLLRMRAIMQRMEIKYPSQLDLLYVSRRIWGKILKARGTGCRLGDLEQHVLRIRRIEDLPGAMVPERYFSFLEHRNIDILREVFAHNLDDIHSLVVLLAKVEQIRREPLAEAGTDLLGVARYLAAENDPGYKKVLAFIADRGDREAMKWLSLLAKRNQDYSVAMYWWKRLLEKGERVFPALELAKYYEHKLGSFSQALYYVDILSEEITAEHTMLHHSVHARRERLQRKLTRSIHQGGKR